MYVCSDTNTLVEHGLDQIERTPLLIVVDGI